MIDYIGGIFTLRYPVKDSSQLQVIDLEVVRGWLVLILVGGGGGGSKHLVDISLTCYSHETGWSLSAPLVVTVLSSTIDNKRHGF